jgi:hypothetical protein
MLWDLRPRFDSRRELELLLFTTASRLALGSTQPPIQWAPAALTRQLKRSGREADDSPPSNGDVMNAWSYTSLPQYVLMAWCLLSNGYIFKLRDFVKHRDSFTFTLQFEVHTCCRTAPYRIVSTNFAVCTNSHVTKRVFSLITSTNQSSRFLEVCVYIPKNSGRGSSVTWWSGFDSSWRHW